MTNSCSLSITSIRSLILWPTYLIFPDLSVSPWLWPHQFLQFIDPTTFSISLVLISSMTAKSFSSLEYTENLLMSHCSDCVPWSCINLRNTKKVSTVSFSSFVKEACRAKGITNRCGVSQSMFSAPNACRLRIFPGLLAPDPHSVSCFRKQPAVQAGVTMLLYDNVDLPLF